MEAEQRAKTKTRPFKKKTKFSFNVTVSQTGIILYLKVGLNQEVQPFRAIQLRESRV